MSKEASSKTLKDQIRLPLWGAIAANLAGFHGFSHYESVMALGVQGLLTNVAGLLPMGLGLGVTTVANGFLSADVKARLVFLRWRQALPGHRAFSTFAVLDPRVDADALKRLLGKSWPTDPVAENRAWFKLFTEIETEPAVRHRPPAVLFTRDLAGLAALFLVTFGSAAAFTMRPASVLAVYLGFLFLHFWLARHAAANYGNRLVCTVLAWQAAVSGAKPASVRSPKAKPQPA